MTNEELKKTTIKTDMELQKMKDNIHELYEENQQLKEKIENARNYIKWHYDLGTKDNVEFCLLRDRLLGILGEK